MRKELLTAIVLVIVTIVFIGLFMLGNSLNQNNIEQEEQETENNSEQSPNIEQACIDLGCEQRTRYVGSKNSDKFYTCDCHYADRIHQENIICFKTKQEAQEQDYQLLDC
jgi:flagellar basal body-associated protein FliL